MTLYGLLSDAHGNKEAFNIAVDLLYKHGAVHLYFLGDSIGYIPSLSVLSAIKSLGSDISCIRGNHEEMLIGAIKLDQSDDVYQLSKIRDKYYEDYPGLIESWPDNLIPKANADVLCIHGSPNDFTGGYVYPDSDLSLYNVNNEYVFMGHTHRPFVRSQNNKKFINVGSCGLPRDHGSFGSAALFDDESKILRVIRFDISRTHDCLIKNGHYVHPDVIKLFSRKSSIFFGEIV
jgi:putative phosphoesterase